ncbi:nucleotidyltransferase family protein [Cellulosimicrobium composti]|uniref:Nucleotidyltransferase family protein n=1 Tax=Cellulosimicrobium composti TaxID=2672572 RepID=A0ABX0B5T7_9MICO|nr:nucleotidyltransferase family protein [Cellulosimicrobium composti]NDO88199.1 nucleotidyltransferase family protein [Cellulosimicrobium composti]
MVDDRDALHDGLRMTAAALAEAEIPHALVGGYAAWARGAPEPSHDADFAIREVDVDRAREVLRAAGLEITEPTENWLFKAYHGGELIDVLYRMVGEPIDDELLARTDEIEVLAVRMPVLSATEIMTSKLRVVGEHYCDFSRLLPVARAMREQIDWVEVRERVDDNPYARAFLFLLDELGVVGAEAMQDDSLGSGGRAAGPASGDPSSPLE